MRLDGKVALITGGASGIGRATVLKFVREGAQVLIADMNLAQAEGVVAEVEALGFAGAAAATQTDVSVFADVEAAVARAVEVFGKLDVIFNNAGIAGGKALLDHDPAVDYAPMIRVDQDGVYYGILAAGRQFRDQGTGGVIISTSSIYGEQAAELAFSYSAAKACGHLVHALSRVRARRVRRARGRHHAGPRRDADHQPVQRRAQGHFRVGAAARRHDRARGDRGRGGLPRLR